MSIKTMNLFEYSKSVTPNLRWSSAEDAFMRFVSSNVDNAETLNRLISYDFIFKFGEHSIYLWCKYHDNDKNRVFADIICDYKYNGNSEALTLAKDMAEKLLDLMQLDYSHIGLNELDKTGLINGKRLDPTISTLTPFATRSVDNRIIRPASPKDKDIIIADLFTNEVIVDKDIVKYNLDKADEYLMYIGTHERDRGALNFPHPYSYAAVTFTSECSCIVSIVNTVDNNHFCALLGEEDGKRCLRYLCTLLESFKKQCIAFLDILGYTKVDINIINCPKEMEEMPEIWKSCRILMEEFKITLDRSIKDNLPLCNLCQTIIDSLTADNYASGFVNSKQHKYLYMLLYNIVANTHATSHMEKECKSRIGSEFYNNYEFKTDDKKLANEVINAIDSMEFFS